MANILVVDDEQAICWGVAKLGQSLGHEVEMAASAEEGLRKAAENPPDLLVLDVRLPGMDGLTAIEHFRVSLGEAPIIVMTAFGDLDTAVKAVRSGAFEYLVKPFDLVEVREAIGRALDSAHSFTTLEHDDAVEMIGAAPVMQTLFKRIALAAASEANVFLRGESGVGKELAARAIHRHSARPEADFVAVNVAALSPSLAESELFGHVEGAFTGASRARKGLLVQANGGTLFLDEVADIPLSLQVKLLRAIEESEVLPVGADQPVKTQFRVIAATHQSLQEQVRLGRFRQDLFFRLCAFEISIPALRERADDIPLLASYFASQFGGGGLRLADATLAELKRRAWHGNVRELRNAMEHAYVMARSGVILPEHLPAAQPSLQDSPDPTPGDKHPYLSEASHRRAKELLSDPAAVGSVYNQFLHEVEKPLLANAMKNFDNECAPAARALGLHRTTLKKKLEQHQLDEQAE